MRINFVLFTLTLQFVGGKLFHDKCPRLCKENNTSRGGEVVIGEEFMWAIVDENIPTRISQMR